MITSKAQAKRDEKKADIQFAKDIKVRDGMKCVICGSEKSLNTHHLFPRERRDTRHNPLNAITLCILHHKFSLAISPHKNAVEFVLWLRWNRPEHFKFLVENAKWNMI